MTLLALTLAVGIVIASIFVAIAIIVGGALN